MWTTLSPHELVRVGHDGQDPFSQPERQILHLVGEREEEADELGWDRPAHRGAG
jgi:hypothetical protein